MSFCPEGGEIRVVCCIYRFDVNADGGGERCFVFRVFPPADLGGDEDRGRNGGGDGGGGTLIFDTLTLNAVETTGLFEEGDVDDRIFPPLVCVLVLPVLGFADPKLDIQARPFRSWNVPARVCVFRGERLVAVRDFVLSVFGGERLVVVRNFVFSVFIGEKLVPLIRVLVGLLPSFTRRFVEFVLDVALEPVLDLVLAPAVGP